MGTSRFVFIVFQLVSLSAAQPNFLHYFCINNNGNYTNNSTYKSNLNTVLSSITSNNNISYGFYNFSAGREPDQANGIALCRGDVTTSDCHSCLNDSTSKLTELCPNQKEAIVWYDNCMLRYTNRSIFGVREDNPRFWMWNLNNASDPDQFSQRLGNLLSSLQSRGASGGSHRKFATGEANASSFQKIYALMQCTPDLSLMDCYNCLGSAMSQIPSCCNGKQGGRVIGPSCALRFETSIFYESADAPSPSPPEAAVSPPLPSTNKTDTTGDHRNTFKVIIIVAVPTVLSVSLFAFICFCFVRRRKARRIDNPDAEDEIGTIDSLQFNFETIRAATGNFSETNKLGQGGFGAVYKGKLSSGEEVAVKRLARNSGQGEAEFKNEILLVAKLQHRNLVRLLGFCLEGEERLLIYEFVANNSLDHYIFDAVKRRQMDWETRYKIIGGIARGLLYLHEDSQLRIIHRDLKASNILLGSKMNPKISDFGIARLVHMDQSHSDTVRVVGTYGYMAPEYALHGLFSVKSDVYSFGVLVLEIISGQRISEFFSREHVQDLITYAWRKWREGTALEIVDPVMLAGSDAEIMRCIHIGLLCVQEEEADRPTMSSVTTMLSSDSVTVPMPSRPAYVVTRSIGYRSSDAYLTANSRVSETHHAKRNSRKIHSR